MSVLYKFLTADCESMHSTKWVTGETKILPSKKNPILCSSDVFHAYKNLNLGVLLNQINSDFSSFKIFEATGNVCVEALGTVGCFFLKITKEIAIPSWYKSEVKKKK